MSQNMNGTAATAGVHAAHMLLNKSEDELSHRNEQMTTVGMSGGGGGAYNEKELNNFYVSNCA